MAPGEAQTSGPGPRPPTHRWLATILMLANAALVFAVMWSGKGADETLAPALLCAGAVALVALAILLRPAAGLVRITGRGVAAAIIAIVAAYGLFGGVLLLIAGGRFSDSEIGFSLAFLAIQLVLLRLLRLDDPDRAGQRILTGIVGVFATVAFFALFYAGQIAHVLVNGAFLSHRLGADSVMTSSVARVQACAAASARRTGGYPASLVVIGPPPAGDGCLDAEHASGTVGPVALSYAPGQPDSSGRITAYQVFARGNVGLQRGEPRMAFGDESGILRSGDPDSLAKLRILHGGMGAVRSVRACAEYHRDRVASDSAYPLSSKDLYPKYPLKEETEEGLQRLGCFPTHFPSFDPGSLMWNQATYAPVGDPAHPRDYVLEIRPRVYGVHGVRSIRTTARGPVHATVENRPATDADPVVPQCSYEVDESCAPGPGGVRARVEVLAPDSASWDEPFAVTVVDRRPPSERTHPYQYWVQCHHRMFIDNTRPERYTQSPAVQCVAEPERENEPGGVRFVRVWVRDYAGAETAVDRRIQIR